MNRAWITGLALAGVAGTSGAAFASMSGDDAQVSLPGELVTASSETSASAPSSSDAPIESAVTYQVGPAGAVTLTRTGDLLTVTTTTAGAGWTVLGASVPGSHVAVQFSDTLQVVTFTADVVGDDVAVMVENLPIGTVAPVVTAPPVGTVPAPAPATPVITQPAPGTTTPSSASTTAPSSGGDDDDDDEYEDDDHDDDHEDDEYEDEDEEGDDD
jgi:hypothetical protein